MKKILLISGDRKGQSFGEGGMELLLRDAEERI